MTFAALEGGLFVDLSSHNVQCGCYLMALLNYTARRLSPFQIPAFSLSYEKPYSSHFGHLQSARLTKSQM